MPEARNFWVICDDNCKFPAMTAEQVLAAIAEATGELPTHIDDAVISKIREQNYNGSLKMWVGTEAEYIRIQQKDPNTLYILADVEDNIEPRISALEQGIGKIGKALNSSEFVHNGDYISNLKDYSCVIAEVETNNVYTHILCSVNETYDLYVIRGSGIVDYQGIGTLKTCRINVNVNRYDNTVSGVACELKDFSDDDAQTGRIVKIYGLY